MVNFHFMIRRFSAGCVAVAICSAGVILLATPAHAGLFSDDEARRGVLELRERLTAAQRTMLEQAAALDQLNQQVATLRGQNEEAAHQVEILQRQQKEYYADLDTRLKKLEPQQQMVDGVEGTVQPGEMAAFNAATQQFHEGNFKDAAVAFRSFIAKYPQSPYQPVAQYWLGNAHYALRDYKGSTATWQNLVKNYPRHARVADALTAIGTNQLEQGQKAAAKKTFEQVIAQFPASNAAQTAQTRLSAIK